MTFRYCGFSRGNLQNVYRYRSRAKLYYKRDSVSLSDRNDGRDINKPLVFPVKMNYIICGSVINAYMEHSSNTF